MKKSRKALLSIMAFITAVISLMPSVYAKTFAPSVNMQNVGVNTQYLYDENAPSWLRKLVFKEDMLSIEGLINEGALTPISPYPYTTDAACFKTEVDENVKLFSLDKNTQKAAYLYILEQLGAISLISEPPAAGQSKADWLRSQGIVVTKEDEEDYNGTIYISSLYALMRNDLYYVYKGEHLYIPEGTTLEDATVMYLVALSGQDTELSRFIYNNFGKTSYGDLDEYVYYTSLMVLYTGGYVIYEDIPTISQEEVSRRMAIMTINKAGISVDADTATNEEISLKYLTAMLSSNYDVTLDPDVVRKALSRNMVAYYILQEMAYEDAKIAISETNYSYEQCFDTVLRKTHRFDLENKFYSDIYEYELHLNNRRKTVNVNPTPIAASGVKVYINNEEHPVGAYSKITLDPDNQAMQAFEIKAVASDGSSSKYLVKIYQGRNEAEESDLTGKIPTIGDIDIEEWETYTGPDGHPHIINNNTVTININGVQVEVPDILNPALDGINGVAETLAGNVVGILHLNEEGQLVDANGNIISAAKYEALPDGFRYVIDENGYVAIAPVEQATEEVTGQTDEGTPKWLAIGIPASVIVLAILLIVFIVVLRNAKDNPQNKSDRMKARKAREKAKREKAAEKKNKKSGKTR